MNREEITQKYLEQHNQLEVEFFDFVSDGIGQKRVLKVGKSIDNFNQKHGDIWGAQEAELIAGGFMEPPEPRRDLIAEIDDLKAQVADHEARLKLDIGGHIR